MSDTAIIESQMPQAGLVTVTLNPALDLSTQADRVVPEHKLRCAEPRVQPGGGGVNVARVVSSLGGAVCAVVAVGGAEGRALASAMIAAGLDIERIRMQHATRSSLSVIDDSTGAQYRFVMPGPEWDADDCARAEAAIKRRAGDGDFVVPSGSFPGGVPPGFFNDLAQAHPEWRMILDTSGAALSEAASRTGLHTLRMDDAEARELTGDPLPEPSDIAVVARDLHRRGAARIVMIAAGAKGNVIACDDGCWLCVPPLVQVVSKTGAGDSFVAAYALAMARGASPLDACIAGTAAASAACETPDSDLCDPERARATIDEVRVHAMPG